MSLLPGAAEALQRFELENDVRTIDSVFQHRADEQQRHLQGRPWLTDPKYFTHVRISALALVKMVMHARSGGNLEVMGLMQGKIDPNDSRGPSLIVMDAFALPVEGTETRVNAQADAYEYMVEFQRLGFEGSRKENVMGWYHSHPGYGCWLSGIDCSTQVEGSPQARKQPHPPRPCRDAPSHAIASPSHRPDAQSAVPGAVARDRHRPDKDSVHRESRNRRVQNLPTGAKCRPALYRIPRPVMASCRPL